MKKFVVLILIVGFSCWTVVSNAQPQLEEPDFPTCEEGYDLILQFEGDLRADIGPLSLTHMFSLECDADLVVVGYAKEGHPENPLCSLEGGPGEPDQCNQLQDIENFEVDVDSINIGGYNDNQGAGGIENAWFDAGPWDTTASAGGHELTFTHTEDGTTGPQSVSYKVSLCARYCDDGLYCNGEETCDLGTNTCQPGTDPCPPTSICDEDTDQCITTTSTTTTITTSIPTTTTVPVTTTTVPVTTTTVPVTTTTVPVTTTTIPVTTTTIPVTTTTIPSEEIPTLSEWGMIIFMTIILGIGVVTILRRRMI